MIKTQFYGVEIEMTGITREQAAKALAKFFLTSASYEGGSYDAWEIKDLKGKTWKIMSDSSLTPERKDGKDGEGKNKYKAFVQHCGSYSEEAKKHRVEMVTPKLEYSDLETLQEAVRTVRKAGAKVNDSCGMHVHVDAKNHTAKSLRNLVNIMYAKEDMLFKALDVWSNRVPYCKRVRESLVTEMQARRPEDLRVIADLWYKETDASGQARNWHYNRTRYAALNLHNVWFRGTVEFRMFNSTLHAGEVKANVQLALAISAQAIKQKTTQVKKTSSGNEKFTFRTWLLHLGLIGDEFETARHHLLKHLEGNSAWRYGQEQAN